ncbi:MAG: triose-phosphate isomerase, partial [Clostridia bacterium]|nr:triose-phosphate isomerase [Clostridia bacterium]
MRKYVIAGNWKMNMTPSAARTFITQLAPHVAGKDKCDIVLCVPYVDIAVAVEAAKGTNIHIGAENVHFEAKGAYTGEVSADMLKEIGTEYVIVG